MVHASAQLNNAPGKSVTRTLTSVPAGMVAFALPTADAGMESRNWRMTLSSLPVQT